MTYTMSNNPPMWVSHPSNLFATFHQYTDPAQRVVIDLLTIECIEQQEEEDHCLILLRSGHYAEVNESIDQVMKTIADRANWRQ